MRVLITGYTGFVGSHLAEYLLARGDVEVFGMHRWRSRFENVQHLGDQVRRVECDLRDPGAVRRVLRDVRPERIFHLAAQSYVPTSWLAPSETLSGMTRSTTPTRRKRRATPGVPTRPVWMRRWRVCDRAVLHP